MYTEQEKYVKWMNYSALITKIHSSITLLQFFKML